MSGQMTNKTVILVGSSSVHTLRFIHALSSKVPHLVLITNKSTDNIPKNVACHEVNFKLNNIMAFRQIGNIIKSYQKHDNSLIIHIHQANSYAYHTIKAINKFHITARVILTTWGSDVLILPNKNLLFKKLVKYNLNHADIITSDSLYMSSKIYELIGENKNIRTINFGIQDFPEQISLKHKENIILSNRLHKPLYRIDRIIKAFAKLIKNSQFNNYTLVIAGGGDDSDKLKQFADNLNLTKKQIIFTGMISYDELQRWYTKAKIFISIPESDSTSLSLLEAMAYGCYPILSNLPANLEWVIDDINGHICQNVEQLENDIEIAINYIADEAKYKQLAEFNHQLIADKAQFSKNILKFVQLYGNIDDK